MFECVRVRINTRICNCHRMATERLDHSKVDIGSTDFCQVFYFHTIIATITMLQQQQQQQQQQKQQQQ